MAIRTRLAPTPSGYLHFGNALSFVVCWALARAQTGWILLRIDDLDASRRRQEYLEDIFQTIEWLGIDYDAGPTGPTDFLSTYSQQLRLPDYHKALYQLKEKDCLFACTCSRKDISLLRTDGLYPGTCRNQNKDLEAPGTAWRVKLPPSKEILIPEWEKGLQSISLTENMGDFVVRQKNRAPAYQIASLVDDEFWGINFIVRGMDLRPSSGAQLFLAQLLGYQNFQKTTFWHHGLITGKDGTKLSKSAGADAMKNWRESGKSPASIIEMAGSWLGLPKAIYTAKELLQGVKEQIT